jgi:riboflavin kinase / FMN adenylyltransferase
MMDQRIVHSLVDLPDVPYVVTIGSFDGVHRGHQHLIEHVTSIARRLNTKSVGITFDPLPAEVLRPDKAPPRICTTEERTSQMLSAGLDRVVVVKFDEQLAQQSAEAFLQAVHAAAHPSAIVVGEDFAFGHKRQGTPEFLFEKAEDYGYQLVVVERLNPHDDVEWSSSFIRRSLVENGDVTAAAQALGRYFRVSGTVQNGDHRGRDLGYPTANLSPMDGLVTPADGIYAAFVTVDGQNGLASRPSLVYVGVRPTFGQSSRVIEVYLLDFDGDLYNKRIEIDFVKRIRGDRAFDSPDELVEQMNKDENCGRQIFSELGVRFSAP